MSLKPIFILILGLVLGCAEPQAAKQSPAGLPETLSEVEKQSIQKEQDPKSHVGASLKIAEERLKNALQLEQEDQISGAEQNLDVFLTLIIYANTYARNTLAFKIKARNHCLKDIEQTVFKQLHNMEMISHALPLEAREAAEARISEVKKVRLRAINDLLGSGQVMNSPN